MYHSRQWALAYGFIEIFKRLRFLGGFHSSTNIGRFYCSLEKKECHSEAGWNELLGSYMDGDQNLIWAAT
jgi:hypothetical protein